MLSWVLCHIKFSVVCFWCLIKLDPANFSAIQQRLPFETKVTQTLSYLNSMRLFVWTACFLCAVHAKFCNFLAGIMTTFFESFLNNAHKISNQWLKQPRERRHQSHVIRCSLTIGYKKYFYHKLCAQSETRISKWFLN